jgi:hypothetical protein
MQAVVVDREFAAKPKLTAIIGDEGKPIVTKLSEEEGTSPTNSEVIVSGKARPCPSSVAIVHIFDNAHCACPAAFEILACTTLLEIEGLLHQAIRPL